MTELGEQYCYVNCGLSGDQCACYRNMLDTLTSTIPTWRTDIENAPRDGTKVLIHTYTGKTGIAWYCKDTGLWPEDEAYSEDGEPCNIGYPTHWQPLPAPPQTAPR